MRTPSQPGADKPIAVSIRVPAEIGLWLKQQAEANHRSVSAEISYRLAQIIRSQQEPAHV